ncbi:hypothetical protein SLS55_003663 [Diplodia seriata]|uniref:Mei2-like C-terminal RNA recognition motif domain-containing protein n=1 Tax=Diplodia seriata TaxID=420778 RepID=A0ABR3CRT5_9PEZI
MPSSSFLGSSPPFSVSDQNLALGVNGHLNMGGHAPHQLALETDMATMYAIVNSLSDHSNVHFSSDPKSVLTRYVKFQSSGLIPIVKASLTSPTHFTHLPTSLTYPLHSSTHFTSLPNCEQEGTIFSRAKRFVKLSSSLVIFEFDKLSQAEAAMKAESELECPGSLQCISVGEYAKLLNNVHPSLGVFNKYEAQVLVNVTHACEEFGDSHQAFLAMLAWMDQSLGSASQRAVVCLGLTANAIGYGFQFRMELDSYDFGEFLLQQSSGCQEIKDCDYFAEVKPFKPTGYEPIPTSSPVTQRGGTTLPRGGPIQVYQLGGPVQPYRERGYSSPRRSSFGSGRRDDQNNAIDVEKIRRGLDVRTTVMLRNIPNQMTTYDLQALLKTWVHGKFDFLYLRIDFANMCNVGYAFVNFDMPMTIVDVKNKLDVQGWPGHLGSSKRAAMSYATVQGVESLIEKFRNSSVMLEAPNCRPRLFYTFQDFPNSMLFPLVGAEKEFPGPNNEAKLARSRQNAETQGLYPAHSREEYRRDSYHSQFDRGNPNGLYAAARMAYY